MELPQCILEVHNFFLYELHIQAKRRMKLKTLEREIFIFEFYNGHQGGIIATQTVAWHANVYPHEDILANNLKG